MTSTALVAPAARWLPRLRTGVGAGRVLARYAAVGAVVAVVGVVHVRRPATVCLLRALTGVPCPFCGGTTAAVDAAHGHLLAAFAASPIALPMLASWPLVGRVDLPRWLADRRRRWTLVLLVLAAAEIWQLHRFGWIGQ